MSEDRVDRIVEQWRHERPDVDVSGMAIIGRISRLERLLRDRLDEVFATHDLESWEFDVLATLRRSGPPYQLSAGGLLESMMISSGTVTHRLDRLERRGLLAREKDPTDGRVVLATLTEDGRRRIDAALEDHAANQIRLLADLTANQRGELADLLRHLHLSLDAEPADLDR
ncbi:MAG: MarR family transcriptional regulator [Actinomycetota bacterium]